MFEKLRCKKNWMEKDEIIFEGKDCSAIETV